MSSKLRYILLTLLIVSLVCGFGLVTGCDSSDGDDDDGGTSGGGGGAGATATLSIEPGTKIVGETAGSTPALIVRQNSKIQAEGNASAPIVMTSEQESGTGEWGGLIINGKAPINRGDTAPGEAQTGTYGGSVSDDSSGTLKYVVVAHAGFRFDPQTELNGIAFQGVGSGTTIDHIQVHRNEDDGVEFFGGTANAKHIFLTENADDSLDWTDGWTGKAQYVSIQKGDPGDQGIEADNLEGDNDATPRSHPTIANISINGTAANDLGILWRRGTGCNLYNAIIEGFGDAQMDIDDSATFDQGTDPAGGTPSDSDNLSIENSLIFTGGGGSDFDEESGTDGFDISDWFNAQNNNIVGEDPQLDSNNVAQLAKLNNNSTLSTGSAIGDSFFDDVDYMGAFDPDASSRWADGWTIPHGQNSTVVWNDSRIDTTSSCPTTVGGLPVTDRGNGVCAIAAGNMDQDANLTNDKVWVLQGYTFVGEEQ